MSRGSDELKSRARLGMWLFISTEILLFGGLFLLYSMYRLKNPADFHDASRELSLFHGTLNTCILITSSLCVVAAVHFLEAEKAALSFLFVMLTVGLGLSFLVVKGFEWAEKFTHGLYPGAQVLLSGPKGEILYFGLYFMMTGLHALHVIIGIGVLSVAAARVLRKTVTGAHPALMENAGLYWHIVDIIWIFLFPLFYLIT